MEMRMEVKEERDGCTFDGALLSRCSIFLLDPAPETVVHRETGVSVVSFCFLLLLLPFRD